MKYHITLLFSCVLLTIQAQTFQDSIILEEQFYDTSGFVDLSKKLIWGLNTEIESGFQYGPVEDSRGVTNQAIHVTAEAMEYAGYQPNTIRASQAVDFRFPQKIVRNQDTLIIEFDALWGTFNSDGWGESGRIVLTLLHDYPEAEIPFGAIDDLAAEAPFGRPAYNLRLRNTDLTGPYQSGSFMLYGGGHDIEGEIEQTDTYWLPGFSSEAGGGSPGLGNPYPLSPTQKNENKPVASVTHWRHYTWVIAPEKLSFYMRDAQASAEEDELVLFMEIPRSDQWEGDIVEQINAAHDTDIMEPPTLYHWFESLEALRLYFRGVQQAYLANLKITHIYESPVVHSRELRGKLQVRLYPNPTQQDVQLDFGAALAHPLTIQLQNTAGQVLKKSEIEKGRTSHHLLLNDVPPGLYFVIGQGGDTNFVKKIMRR